jgi:hypothetical protein
MANSEMAFKVLDFFYRTYNFVFHDCLKNMFEPSRSQVIAAQWYLHNMRSAGVKESVA